MSLRLLRVRLWDGFMNIKAFQRPISHTFLTQKHKEKKVFILFMIHFHE